MPQRPPASRGSRRSARCRRRRTSTPSTSARWEIVILVCAIARSPARSIEVPPRKCRMLTPRSKPSRLTRMKSAAEPWNQVAIMRPSSCQTVAKRSQSPASRHTAQFSIRSRIVRRSSGISPPLTRTDISITRVWQCLAEASHPAARCTWTSRVRARSCSPRWSGGRHRRAGPRRRRPDRHQGRPAPARAVAAHGAPG